MSAYYNENDSKTAAWLRELIKAGLIADGEVDERSIVEVTADDVRGFTQCHFFAGIGGWSCALRLAGWPDDRSVWTGSCPCQPFSSAGKGDGANDSRDLWPAWFQLIRQCAPHVVLGEQVASADGLGWLDRVSADMEAADYALGAVDLCAASVGAFHIRQRLWFVADAQSGRDIRQRSGRVFSERFHDSETSGVAESNSERCEGERLRVQPGESRQAGVEVGRCGEVGELGDSDNAGLKDEPDARADRACGTAAARTSKGRSVQIGNSSWADVEWLPCRDGKSRPVEPGTSTLATGVPNRMVKLRGYGNAIVPQVAAAFIEAYVAARGLDRTA